MKLVDCRNAYQRAKVAFFLVFAAALPCFGQAVPQPDVLLLVDGEKLIGHLESADATTVLFKSDLAGEVKVDWTKIQDLQSSSKFAIAKKGQRFARKQDLSQIPQGTLAVAEQKITITPSAGQPQTVPVAYTQNVIPEDSFQRAFSRPKLRDYWTGAASVGFSLVDATQTSKNVASALSMIRTVPAEAWISPRYRTSLDFSSAYGTTTSGPLTIKTNIFHAGVEQDEYLSPRLFAFGQGTFDHNFSQGLDLQYTLGGGLGYVAYKDAHQELDLKGQIAYTNQMFSVGPSTHLIGAVLGETYNRAFTRGIVLHEELSVIPAFNELNDYTANGLINLAVPITKKIAFTIGALDSYLNNPPSGFKKNSFQIITNLTYKIN